MIDAVIHNQSSPLLANAGGLISFTRLNNPVLSNTIGTISDPSKGSVVLQLILRNLITFAFGLGGIIFFFMLVRGGYQYMTAGSDKEGIQNATKRLTTAFIGITILFSVFALMLIVEALFGINLRRINIPVIQ